jgi:thiamine-phosphate pyrophosphorylase
MMEKQIYAAIDANINRAMEGIRVCEDIMRFCLCRSDVSTRLKEIRHRVAEAARRFNQGMVLYGRDVEADAQKFVDLEGERRRASLADLFFANMHRAMEAVRSLEEFSKLESSDAKGNPFQEIRFIMYALEREAIPLMKRQNRMSKFNRALYAILDMGRVAEDHYVEAAVEMIRGGTAIIQLRMKSGSKKQILRTAKDVARLCHDEGVLFIVNDHPDIAVLSGADGVHLGWNDLGARDVRKLVPPETIIGLTAYSYGHALRAADEEPDYMAIGPVFDTSYDTGRELVNLKGQGTEPLSRVKAAVQIPLVAIGGITAGNVTEVLAAGADAVAVSSYIYKDSNIEKNCRTLIQAMKINSGP